MKTRLFLYAVLLINLKSAAQCDTWINESSISNGQGTWSITSDKNNNIYSSGSFTDSILFGGTQLINNTISGFSYYINKYNSSGAIQWATQLKCTNYQSFPPVIYQKDGSLYIAGVYNDTIIIDDKSGAKLVSSGGYNNFLLKYDLNGNLLWAKDFKASTNATENAVFGIAVNNFKQVYFTGRFEDTLSFGSTLLAAPGVLNRETFLTKTDSSGNVIWSIQSNSTANSAYCRGWGITIDKNENVIIGGLFTSNISFGTQSFIANNSIIYADNPYVAKFDSSGNCQWITGGQGPVSFSNVYDLVTDNKSNIYFAGSLDSTITFNGTVLKTKDGKFYYAKYSPNGNLIWVKQCGNSINASQTPSSLQIDFSNNLWMGGWVYGPSDFGNYHLKDSAIFLAEFDTSGNFLNAIGSKGTTSGYTSALDSNGDIYLGCSSFFKLISFDSISVTGPDEDTNGVDVIMKYCNSITGITLPKKDNKRLLLFPNPAEKQVTFVYQYSGSDNAILEIYDILGEEMGRFNTKASSGQYIMGLNNFGNGVYFYRMSIPCCEIGTGKFVVIK